MSHFDSSYPPFEQRMRDYQKFSTLSEVRFRLEVLDFLNRIATAVEKSVPAEPAKTNVTRLLENNPGLATSYRYPEDGPTLSQHLGLDDPWHE